MGKKKHTSYWDGWEGGSLSNQWSGKSEYVTTCYKSHPVLKLGKGEIVGGKCSDVRPGYDVYVSLSEYYDVHPKSYPWVKEGRVEDIHFPITDYSVPKKDENVANFKSLILWLKWKLDHGKRVHIGCMGGHGRTGLVLAALVSLYGEKDPIAWIRKNHCSKAVESDSQVDFLVKHYGAKRVEGAKKYVAATTAYSKGYGGYSGGYTIGPDGVVNVKSDYKGTSASNISAPSVYAPQKSPKSIWNI